MNTNHIPGLIALPLEHLPELIDRRRVGVVTDAYLAHLPAVDELFTSLDAEAFITEVGEPTTETVAAVARRLEQSQIETVVALGGGSSIDTGKLAALAAVTGTAVEWHLGTIRVIEAAVDVIAVPTTSGSGAEVTRTCVVSHEGRKSWAWNELLRPGRVLVDPSVTHGLPRSATVATGLDALVHGLEAATSPNADPEAIASGTAAINVVIDALPAVTADGSDPAARAEMLDAALCAGYAIDRAGTGIGHGVGHALGSLLTIPHGLAVAFGMWTCLSWGKAGADDRYARVDVRGDLEQVIGTLLATIEFERELRRWASSPLDPAALAIELAREEHRPMRLNNARPVADDDIAVVAELVARRWNEALA